MYLPALMTGETEQCNMRIHQKLLRAALAKAAAEGLDKSEMFKLLLMAYVDGKISFAESGD